MATATTLPSRGLTFQVDDVAPTGLPSASSPSQFKNAFLEDGQTLEYASLELDDQQTWTDAKGHGFFRAGMRSFAEHHGLVFSADMLLQMILEGLSIHVAKHPEELRSRFVAHEGKVKIELQRHDFVMGSDKNDWAGVVNEFSAEIRRLAQPSVYEELIGEPFSTSTPTDIVCHHIALMSTVRHYFRYVMLTGCGHPSVTLLGTRQDYVLLRDKAQRLVDYMMPEFAKQWLPALDSILVRFVSAWDGEIDKFFWGSYCKYASGMGSGAGTNVSGWINILFPFISEKNTPNEYCLPWEDLAHKVAERERTKPAVQVNAWDYYISPGNAVDSYVRRFCFADVEWMYYGENVPLVFKAGFVGYTTERATGAIKPQLGWAIVHPRKADAKVAEKKESYFDRSGWA